MITLVKYSYRNRCHCFFRSVLGACLYLSVIFFPSFSAQASDVEEYTLKALIIYKLPNFIYWQNKELKLTGLNFCMIGDTPFGSILYELLKMGENHFNEIDDISDMDTLKSCHLIFISRSEREKLTDILQAIIDESIISISDIQGFSDAGGMVELTTQTNKVSITINRQSAVQVGVDFSAQLLKLANRVIQ